MKFRIRKNKGGEFFWQLVGSNGEVMAVSEGMSSKQSVRDSIDSVKRNAGEAEVVDKSDEDAA
ncbi:MAG TPA: DUF1508 domain-containing protein [Candidatus Limnocylindrales bacterium]|nr:DUF1508 domain-containing protein [Candidatus Limnocylindrales bacterium]